jgi:hypothetical protein
MTTKTDLNWVRPELLRDVDTWMAYCSVRDEVSRVPGALDAFNVASVCRQALEFWRTVGAKSEQSPRWTAAYGAVLRALGVQP